MKAVILAGVYGSRISEESGLSGEQIAGKANRHFYLKTKQ